METVKKRNLCSIIFIIIATSQLVYLNSLLNQFAYDDEFTIVQNHFIKTWSNLPLLFHKKYFQFSGELSYRPIVTLSYFIDYTLWKLNPLGFHLTNTLFHTLNCILVFCLFSRILNHRVASLISTLLFSCHPVLTEAVNAISYREDLLGATFFLSAFFLYLNASKGKRWFNPLYYASVVCYLFGVFSKEMAITLPIFIVLADVLFTKEPTLRYKAIRYYPGYLFVAAFYLVTRFVLLHNPVESHVSYPGDSVFVNFLTMFKVLASYIKLFFFPFHLCADYVIQNSYSFFDISFILSFLLLSSVAIITYRTFFHSKGAFFSLLWFFVSLLPVLNIVPIENIMAERYLYLPILGFCMTCGYLLTYLKSFGLFDKPDGLLYSCTRAGIRDQGSATSGQRLWVGSSASDQRLPGSIQIVGGGKRLFLWNIATLAILILIFVFIIFSITTIRRNNIWMNQAILWTNTAKRSPKSFKAHNNLGNMYRDAGRFDEAIVEFKHAIQLCDTYIDAHNNLGVTYRKKGMLNEAVSEYQRALHLNPQYPYAHNNLGVLYAKSNLLDLAITEFTKAISNKPDYFDAHNNLGATYIRKGLYEQAIEECLEAVKYNDRYKDAYYNLSAAYFNQKQLDEALEAVKKVLSLDPNHLNACELFNVICERKGLTERK